MRLAFLEQRRQAKQRGIPFLLTFEEWQEIWWASGHAHQRGYKAGEYCMARFGDSGPYAKDNVAIISVEQNHRDANLGVRRSAETKKKMGEAKLGELNPRAKLTTKIVRQIRNEYVSGSRTHGQHALAKKYGCTSAAICMIVNNKRWRVI